jgi:hypothetical protein
VPDISDVQVMKLKKDLLFIANSLRSARREVTGEMRVNDEVKRLWLLYEENRQALCKLDAILFGGLREVPIPTAKRVSHLYPMTGEEARPEGVEVFNPGDYSILWTESGRALEYFEVFEKAYAATKQQVEPISVLNLLSIRFHQVARQLRSRYSHRPTLDVDDEYDVQDLLHALLRIHFNDIRPEEWTPSYAGKSGKMDFLLKTEQVVIETKKARKGLDAKVLGDELLIDIQRYQAHPDCKTLFCFVYDPEGKIANPTGIENDLSKTHNDLKVLVVIGPK